MIRKKEGMEGYGMEEGRMEWRRNGMEWKDK